jgi:Na+/H+ antiporter NhaC
MKALLAPIIVLILVTVFVFWVTDAETRTPLKVFSQSEITLNNGVPCVLLQGANKLALSCDWANRRLSNANNL